eukprot:590689-Pleurochrysis_carterae.AAC.2
MQERASVREHMRTCAGTDPRSYVCTCALSFAPMQHAVHVPARDASKAFAGHEILRRMHSHAATLVFPPRSPTSTHTRAQSLR